MKHPPGRWQCGFFLVCLFVLMLVQAPMLAAGAILTSMRFWFGVWAFLILLGGWAAFIH